MISNRVIKVCMSVVRVILSYGTVFLYVSLSKSHIIICFCCNVLLSALSHFLCHYVKEISVDASRNSGTPFCFFLFCFISVCLQKHYIPFFAGYVLRIS